MSYQNGINNLQQLFTQLNTPSTTQTGQVSGGAVTSGSKATTDALLSTTSDQTSFSTLGGLAAQASQGDDVRLDKVAALQSAINSGTYNVSSSNVADSIINSLLNS